ncbi:MAG: 3-phosphoglycerate dehydrogenase family protein [Gammaproteobacteria bacterium]|jgi:D-3-phosphoglycerate dehydrogenase|uniref:D-3-phosphoglycerate dehydrogenase n=1 Tax=SAR86 cluster bacterium TaxID=2030880 RepID=A0A520MV09_9GAMM|nr:MAG: 3-phosphoglycerate dehydrogenase [SAR86 cluster bacterium]
MKIKILNNIAKEGLDIFDLNNFQIANEDPNPSGIVLRSHDLTELQIPKKLLGIARAGAGTNNINIDECSSHGVVVFNTPGANANAVKEMVICSLILSRRDLVSGNRNLDSLITEGKSDQEISSEIEGMKKKYQGEEVKGKTLGVIGLGAIGSMVAEQSMSLGMKVNAYDPGLTVDTALRLPSSLQRFESMEEVLQNSDFISLHLPLTKNTKGIINEAKLKLFKKNSVLINFSRGGVVDENSLIKFLDNQHLHKYVTDFPTKQLLQRLNTKKDVVIFPHLGASTKESEVNCAVMACSQLCDFIKEGRIINSVNFPNIESEKIGKHRLFITNKNEPGIISNIAECLASNKINILEFVNKSRGTLACNIIDTDDNINHTIVSELERISGVTIARLCY